MPEPNYAQEVEELGYTVIKQAFSREEIARLRASLESYFQGGDYTYLFGGKARPDAFNAERLADITWLLSNERIANALKQIAGPDIRFCHHSDAHCNLISGWHKDDTGYGETDHWAPSESGDTYAVYKIGLYLDDHSDNTATSSPLRVRKGSHRLQNLDEGEVYAIPTQVGDAIIFDCRISHMGLSDILLENPLAGKFRAVIERLPSAEAKYKARTLYRRLRGIPDRYALFYVFGRPNEFTQDHIDGNVKRQNKQKKGETAQLSERVIEELTKVGIGY